MRKAVTVIMAAALSACGNITDYKDVSTEGTKLDGDFIAGVGDTVLQIIKEESLPNIFGKADVYGRKRPTGTVTVIYAGVADGKAIFYRRDVDIRSEKTAMNTSPITTSQRSTTSYSGFAGNTPISGTATTTMPVYLPPNTPRDEVAGIRDITLKVEIGSGDGILVEGSLISVTEATDNIVRYTMTRLDQDND